MGAVATLDVRQDRARVVHVAFDLSGDAALDADGEDGHVRVVFGQHACRLARLGEDNDRLRADVRRRLDGRRRSRLAVRDRLARELRALHELEDVIVAARRVRVDAHLLRLEARASHNLDGALGKRAVRRLARKHHAVCAVEDRVGHVRALGARGARVLDHRLEHLGRDDDGFASLAALGDHDLLLAEHLLGRDLHTQVASRHHDPVRGLEDLVKVVKALLVLDLGDDLDARAIRAQHLADEMHVLRRLHE